MNSREVMQMALDALDFTDSEPGSIAWEREKEAIDALKAALAEPQEPVAWGMRHSDGRIYDCIAPGEHDREPGRYTVPLYTRPAPQRQPLTQYEAWEIWDALADRGKKGEDIVHAFARAIERAHGITGETK